MLNRFFGVMLVAAVVVSLTLAASVSAAPSTTTLGCVDVQAVFDGYQKTDQSKNDLETLNRDIETKLQAMDAHRLLSENDLQELLTLVVKQNPTDKEKERIKALQDQERALDSEMKDLQGKKEALTAQEKSRLKELQDRQSDSEITIGKMVEDARNEIMEKGNTLTDEIRTDILKAIEDVAKAKGLTAVVDKIAVLYGGTDITQAVIDKLNSKK